MCLHIYINTYYVVFICSCFTFIQLFSMENTGIVKYFCFYDVFVDAIELLRNGNSNKFNANNVILHYCISDDLDRFPQEFW